MEGSITEEIYPLCFKIKETCPPCSAAVASSSSSPPSKAAGTEIIVQKPLDCVEQWAAYERAFSARDKEQRLQALFDCLQKYGDIYAKLGIELYVNPKTKQITFPDATRIQANFNQFLRDSNWSTTSPKERNAMDEKLMMYNILTLDALRKQYNEFYPSYGFSELSSLQPKEYGIARLMGPADSDEPSSGGKRKRRRTRRRRRQTKRNRKYASRRRF